MCVCCSRLCGALVYSAAGLRRGSMKSRDEHETLELIRTHDMGLAFWFQISHVVSAPPPSVFVLFSLSSHLLSSSPSWMCSSLSVCLFSFFFFKSGSGSVVLCSLLCFIFSYPLFLMANLYIFCASLKTIITTISGTLLDTITSCWSTTLGLAFNNSWMYCRCLTNSPSWSSDDESWWL